MKLSFCRRVALVICLTAPFGCVSDPISSRMPSLPKPPQPEFMSAKLHEPPTQQASFTDEMAKGHSHETSGKLAEAREVYEQSIVDFPERYEPYHRLAVVADRQNRYREAQRLYTEALRLHPNDPQLLNDLGYCFFLQGQLGKAESAMLKAVSRDPSNARYRNNLGLVYGHRGEHERALEEFRRAGSEADAQYSLAFILASRDDVDGAMDRFRLALASDPTHEKARNALRDFERYEKDPQGVLDNSQIVKDGVRYVPYIEPAAASPGTQHVTVSATSRSEPKTNSLQQKAHRMLAERLQARAE